jgi:hypothetical protein
MPFGKHKGRLVSDVPTSYLRWLLRECDLDPPLRRAVVGELTNREAYHEPAGHGASGAVLDVRGKLQTWYREMAMKFHPDRCFDDGAAMKAINHGYERLQELLGEGR